MCPWYERLKWFRDICLVAATIALGAAILVNLLFADFRPEVRNFLDQYPFLPIGGIGSLVALAVVLTFLVRAARRDCLTKEFALLTLATALTPADLDFEMLPGDGKRPFGPSKAIPRRLVRVDGTDGRDGIPSSYTVETLRKALEGGESFILLGQPTEGKTRTVYEIIRPMDGYLVVKLDRTKVPADEAFSLLRGRWVILLLDDLNGYVGKGTIDIQALWVKLSKASPSSVVAATCRDGSELGAVAKSVDGSLGKFYEEIPLKLRLMAISDAEKGDLAKAMDIPWDPDQSELFPTPGFITMKDAIASQKRKFDAFAQEHPEYQAALRALRLLRAAGVLPFTHRRVQAVLKGIFRYDLPSLGPCLSTLATEHFLRPPAEQDPCDPEPAYLRSAVRYTDAANRDESDDFQSLRDVLDQLTDADGLYYLGLSLYKLQRYDEAINANDRALQIRPAFPCQHRNEIGSPADLMKLARPLRGFSGGGDRPSRGRTWPSSST